MSSRASTYTIRRSARTGATSPSTRTALSIRRCRADRRLYPRPKGGRDALDQQDSGGANADQPADRATLSADAGTIVFRDESDEYGVFVRSGFFHRYLCRSVAVRRVCADLA
ncbi:hypothetical protein [Cohnella faecalis]|uniref:Uncharacterized protein n=1 Tax=Cohnella faecalis TaxID=2315694 RepID=A0A398CGT6_9BACL|nr:hypothetical protein [Cohnella faecalis]RIE00289.1 hypothetical protein D3H35_29390 [Cohnella faecalis]